MLVQLYHNTIYNPNGFGMAFRNWVYPILMNQTAIFLTDRPLDPISLSLTMWRCVKEPVQDHFRPIPLILVGQAIRVVENNSGAIFASNVVAGSVQGGGTTISASGYPFLNFSLLIDILAPISLILWALIGVRSLTSLGLAKQTTLTSLLVPSISYNSSATEFQMISILLLVLGKLLVSI